MRPIQILMDDALVQRLDREAKRRKLDRSKLIRAAVIAFIADARRRKLEEAYRRGYEQTPQRADEVEDWEGSEAWPEA